MKAFVKEQPHKYCDIINIGALQEPLIKQLQIRSAKTAFFSGYSFVVYYSMGEELHPSLRHGRNRGLNGGVPEVVWFEGSVVDQLFMHPRTPLPLFNTAKWWAEYCSPPINYLGIGCILGVNQLHKSTLPIIHNTVVQGQDSHHMAELNIFLGDLNLCNTFCRKKVRLTVICCWVGQNYWRCEAGGCSQGWQTKTSGDLLGPRPDQFRPIHFDLLHLLDFCAFNDIDTKYFVCFSCKRTFGIEYDFVAQYIYSVFGSVWDWMVFGVARRCQVILVGHLGDRVTVMPTL